MSTLLKCPRCSTQFDTETATLTSGGHVVCPNCSAKLRLRTRSAAAVPQAPVEPSSGSAAGEIVLPGFGTDAKGADGSSIGARGETSSASSSRPRDREADVTIDPGTKLGGFEIRRVLGRGGMATVYKATQLSLNRAVAVKVLAKRFSRSQLFVDRFDREAGALAGLNHPNIVNIIDKGVIEENYFFVMELVEGITLDQLLHSVELTEQHYLHIIGEISKALSYVHSKGIIHRDIKPSNILVNRQGVVKVGDFGIAHMTDAEAPTERFGRNATVGTAHYMSPEQATSPGAVDARADIYSLAVTFYKMFTRQLPPAAGQDLPIRPCTELNAALPKAVDAILLRAMNPDPANRHADVAEFCDALVRAFTSRTGNDLVGAAAATAASMSDSGTLLFNTNLFAAAAKSSVAADSNFLQSVGANATSGSGAGASTAASAGTSLLASPFEIPGLVPDSTTSGFGSTAANPSSSTPVPFPSPFATTPSFQRPEPAAPIQEESAPSRKKLYIILTIIAIILALMVGGGLTMYIHMTAY